MTDSRATETVRERIEDELDADEIHGIAFTRIDGRIESGTIYAIVSQSTTWDQIDDDIEIDLPVLDLRTVVIDTEEDTVRVTDNGLWLPQEKGAAESLTRILGRTTTDLNGGSTLDEPALQSADFQIDPDEVLDREIEVEPETVEGQYTDMMENHLGIDPARPWGYGAGPPPEIEHVVERLQEAGLDPANHVTRLVFGKKEPMDRKPRPVGELKGNYGIELLPRESGLVALDVDYPEHFPDDDLDLPETLEVSSPHGEDDQRHIVLRCEQKERIAEELGAWAVQSVEWGDLWIGDRYLVGPGSQLSEFGCDNGPHTRGERGGCSHCESETGGYYEIVSDAPIAEIDAETILDLVDEDDGEPRDGPADPDPPGDDVDDEVDEDQGRCDNCEAVREIEELKTVTILGDSKTICSGGCE